MTTRVERIATYAVLCLLSAAVLLPLANVVLLSLHPSEELVPGFAFPHHPTGKTYAYAWHAGRFHSYMQASLIVTPVVTLAAVFLSILAGYALGTLRPRGSRPLFLFLLFGLMVPWEALILPIYFDFRGLGLLNTYWALILPQAAISLSFGAFWMRAFFRAAPDTLIEAARMDGMSSWTILWRVLVPLGAPAILTLAVLVFLWTWNEFLLPLVLTTEQGPQTLPVGLAFFSSRYTTDFPGLAAGSVIVALPVILVYVLLQRHFFRGMLSGAIR